MPLVYSCCDCENRVISCLGVIFLKEKVVVALLLPTAAPQNVSFSNINQILQWQGAEAAQHITYETEK